MGKVLVLFLVASCTNLIFCIDPKSVENVDLDGPHVCERTETYNETVVVTIMVPYQIFAKVWCASIPPRCIKTSTHLKQENRTEIAMRIKKFRECCKGFMEVQNRCVEDCEVHCVENQCPCKNGGICHGSGDCYCRGGYCGPL